MARIAMGEATDNSDERLRIMWLIKIRAELGYMNANARGRDLFYIDHYGQKSTIRNELLKDSKQFQVVDAALPVLDPERDTYLANLPHIKAMLYPNDNQVEEFKTLYSNAKLILTIQEDGLKTSTDPQLNQIRGYDEYRAYAITKSEEGQVLWNGGKTSQLLGSGSSNTINLWRDVLPMDNVFFGQTSCQDVKILVEEFNYWPTLFEKPVQCN